jgi:ribosomal protein S14
VGSLITFVRLISEIISNNLLFSRNKSTFKSPFMIMFYMRKIPSKLVRIRLNDKPWFNSEIRKEIRTRNRLHKLARRNQSCNRAKILVKKFGLCLVFIYELT